MCVFAIFVYPMSPVYSSIKEDGSASQATPVTNQGWTGHSGIEILVAEAFLIAHTKFQKEGLSKRPIDPTQRPFDPSPPLPLFAIKLLFGGIFAVHISYSSSIATQHRKIYPNI
jgi:hypothetical protein